MTHTLPKLNRPPSIIETRRLRLRFPSIEDALTLHDLAAADPAFAHATVGRASSTLDTACTAIARMLEDHRTGAGRWWVVSVKSSRQIIGVTGFSSRYSGQDPIHALATEALGEGFAREIISALVANTASSASKRPSPDPLPANGKPLQPAPPTRWYWHSKNRPLPRSRNLRSV